MSTTTGLRHEGPGCRPAALVPGLHNLRGLAVAADGTLVTGDGAVLLRADSPAGLDAAGVAALAALGVDRVVDLRSAAEVAAASYAFAGTERIGLALELLDPAEARVLTRTLGELYLRVVAEHGATLTAAVAAIADHTGGAVLVHCTAGKDRTGLVVALALLAAGATRAAVVEDYHRTHANLAGEWTERMLALLGLDRATVPAHVLEILNGSPAHVLEGALDAVAASHGDAAGYLTAHGLTADQLAALRRRLAHTTPTHGADRTDDDATTTGAA